VRRQAAFALGQIR